MQKIRKRRKATARAGGNGPDDLSQQIAGFFVTYSAARHLALYRTTKNGLLIWKAYLEYRQHGRPVPEGLLAMFDAMAARLLRARGQKQIAQALEMTSAKLCGRGGGPQGASLLKGQERDRDIVEAYAHACDANEGATPKRKISEVAEQVGKVFGISGEEVQVRRSQWKKVKGTRKNA